MYASTTRPPVVMLSTTSRVDTLRCGYRVSGLWIAYGMAMAVSTT